MRTSDILPHQVNTGLHQDGCGGSVISVFIIKIHVDSMPSLSGFLKEKRQNIETRKL